MLRAVRPATRLLSAKAPYRPLRQQQVFAQRPGTSIIFQRGFADEKRADQAVLPGSQSVDAPDDPSTIPGLRSITPAIAPAPPPGIAADNIPRTPPTPEEVGAVAPAPTPAATTTSPPTPPPTDTSTASSAPVAPLPPPRKPRRTFRRLLYLITFLGLSYAGGVYYSLINDNFHDFFTEYVPYGENAVLYFEEREFRRRFPGRAKTPAPSTKFYPQVSGEKKVTVGAKSGMASRVTDDPPDSGQKGRHVSAVPSAPAADKPKEVQAAIAEEARASSSDAKVVDKKPEPAKPTAVTSTDDTPTPKLPAKTKSEPTPAAAAPAAPIQEALPPPPAPKPVTPIDPLKVSNAADPLVQEITKLVNDVIQAVNADGASDMYRTVLTSAKDSVGKLATDIATYRSADLAAAEQKIRQEKEQFDKAALELVRRVREEQKEQELRWREEYETERQHLAQNFEDKLKAELEVAEKIAAQRRQNELLEQEKKLQDSFVSSIRDRIETERSGRLSKLDQLSSTVTELESLTSKWNEVVDANLKAQHLIVAVDAVRTMIDTADRPTPFLGELVALKDIAADDPVVTAAVNSISAAAYSRGIPTTAQLIDRFRRVAAEVRKAALLPEEAGVASHAASFVLSKVMFRKSGLAVGDDVESILTRTETLLEEGDLDEATREMNSLQGWAKVLSRDWLKECRVVLEVRQALDVMAAEARLRTLMVE